MQIQKMTADMHDTVLEMVEQFYRSDAVSHPVPIEKLEQTFADAVSDDPVLEGYVLTEMDEIIGFAYVTVFYACEVGGRCMMIEELFVKENYRGKGYGTQFFNWLSAYRPEIKRFRLEVTEANENAIKLYKKWGFEFFDYKQMVREQSE